MPDSDLQLLLKRLIKRHGTQTAVADAIGISSSGFTKVVNNEKGGTLNIVNCLRLAKVSGVPASQVLRMAGKDEVAGLIETLYGKEVHPSISADERELLDDVEALTHRAKDILRALVTDLLPKKPAKHKRTA